MLSLPEDQDYTTERPARICKDGMDSICVTVEELEEQGHIIHERIRNSKRQLTIIEYIVLEQSKPPLPKQENPVLDSPILGSPKQASPGQESPAQLNMRKSSNQKSNADLSNMEPSNPIQSNLYKPQAVAGIGMGTRETYHEIILESVEYGTLIQDRKLNRGRLNEVVKPLVDMVCSTKQAACVSGNDFLVETMKSRLLKLDSSHIQYVFDCMASSTAYVHNIERYLLAALFNAPATIGNYCFALVNHGLYGSGERRWPMQEEVTQKTIALFTQATRLTASVLQKALEKLLKPGRNKFTQPNRGKQTLRQLMKHNTGVSSVEIINDNTRIFEYMAKKYGIDSALKKDIFTYLPYYLVLLKGRGTDVPIAAFKELSTKNLNHEKKPSAHKLLPQIREKAEQRRQREKAKTKDRGQEL